MTVVTPEMGRKFLSKVKLISSRFNVIALYLGPSKSSNPDTCEAEVESVDYEGKIYRRTVITTKMARRECLHSFIIIIIVVVVDDKHADCINYIFRVLA